MDLAIRDSMPIAITSSRSLPRISSSVNLTADEERATREKVASYLAEKPGPDENALAIEGLRYLRLMPRDRV
jgi:hypothetical protein